MSNNHESLNPEVIEAVKEAVENSTGIEFATFLGAYREKNLDQPNLTEEDLVAEILEAGSYQKEDDSSFEDAVMIGAFAMGSDLGLF